MVAGQRIHLPRKCCFVGVLYVDCLIHLYEQVQELERRDMDNFRESEMREQGREAELESERASLTAEREALRQRLTEAEVQFLLSSVSFGPNVSLLHQQGNDLKIFTVCACICAGCKYGAKKKAFICRGSVPARRYGVQTKVRVTKSSKSKRILITFFLITYLRGVC